MREGKTVEVVVTYSLPEDEHEWELCKGALGYASVLSDLSEKLRQLYKWDDERTSKMTGTDMVDEIRQLLFDLCGEHNVDLHRV